MKKISLSAARETRFENMGRVEILSGKNQGKFLINAYTGKPVERAWGMLCIDVLGITAKQSIPVLMNHDHGQIVGHSTRTYANGSFFVEGQFSKATIEAEKVKSLASEGFPWQASIGVRPLEIMEIGSGHSQVVNGNTVLGPAEIWTKSEVFETSFVPLGADSDTSIETFNKTKGQEKMSTAQQEFDRDTALQAEFGDFETYRAYLHTEYNWDVRTKGAEKATGRLKTQTDAKTQWLASPALREEFFGDFDMFEAYLKTKKGGVNA